MFYNKILNVHKPLLKSYITNTYQKIYLDSFSCPNEDSYYLNQMKALWDASINELSLEYIENKYKEENRDFSIQDYKTLFLSKINQSYFSENQEVLDHIYQDMNKVSLVLKKLDEIGISYSMDITGGAVRDFVTNKPIKDLDIMLSIDNNYVNKKILNKMTDVLFLKKHFDSAAILEYLNQIIVSEHSDEDFILKKQHLMTLCFKDLIGEKYTFTSSNRKEENQNEDYNENMLQHNRLLGVFKLNQEKMDLHYPVDILLTDFTKIAFLKDFDFDICKATFSLVNCTYKTQFPNDSTELISRFSAERDFWADIHNKKITMNVDYMTRKNIENSITKHFKRLKEKYPEYKFNIISNVDSKNRQYAIELYQEHYL